jgi:hypothetical protein
MEPAVQIIFRGMHYGWFTGKKLSDYINVDTGLKDYANARRIVNGTDKMNTIAGYAQAFEVALEASMNIETETPPEMPEPLPPEVLPPIVRPPIDIGPGDDGPFLTVKEMVERIKEQTGAKKITIEW